MTTVDRREELAALLRAAAVRFSPDDVAEVAADLVGCELVPKPDDDRPRLPIAEFRQLGFVQEINRRLLHPAGLALEVAVEGEEAWLVGVWDCRDDPEGIYFGPGVVDPELAYRLDHDLAARREPRERALGYVVQPVEQGPTS